MHRIWSHKPDTRHGLTSEENNHQLWKVSLVFSRFAAVLQPKNNLSYRNSEAALPRHYSDVPEDINGYFTSVFTRDDISSLTVPDANFQEAKSDYIGRLIVTLEMVAKKIKAMKDNTWSG